jgi:hypothetical protein
MPKNTTGGSGHKGRANGEGKTTKKNRSLIEDYLEDMRNEGKCESVVLGRVLRNLGDGRMMVFAIENNYAQELNVKIKGSLTGRGKAQARIGQGSFVLVSSAQGLSGSNAYEIIAVMDEVQMSHLGRIATVDPRILAKDITDFEQLRRPIEIGDGFEFDALVDPVIDNI